MAKDVRKEQVALLRFEKQLAGLAATLAAGAGVAKAADGKLNATEGVEAYAEMQAALVHLAEVTGKAHDAMNAKAIEVGATILNAGGGTPKKPPAEVIASILGIG